MKILAWGFGLFLAAILLHIVIWRTRFPRNPIRSLISIFFLVAAAGIILLPLSGKQDLLRVSYALFVFFSLSASYLVSYPAVETDSPSLLIIRKIALAGKEGVSREELKISLDDSLLIEARMTELVDSRLVEMSGSRYRISNNGNAFVAVFTGFRGLLGLGRGG